MTWASGGTSNGMESACHPVMVDGNRCTLGVFGAHCASGRTATAVPERWLNTFVDHIRLTQMADAAGLL